MSSRVLLGTPWSSPPSSDPTGRLRATRRSAGPGAPGRAVKVSSVSPDPCSPPTTGRLPVSVGSPGLVSEPLVPEETYPVHETPTRRPPVHRHTRRGGPRSPVHGRRHGSHTRCPPTPIALPHRGGGVRVDIGGSGPVRSTEVGVSGLSFSVLGRPVPTHSPRRGAGFGTRGADASLSRSVRGVSSRLRCRPEGGPTPVPGRTSSSSRSRCILTRCGRR